MANADFYSINFEKEISLQGRSTIFLSIQANGEYGEDEALWVTPYIQPQTFKSKFEGWASAAGDITGSTNTILYFKENGFAKTGQDFSLAAWESILVGDDVKAVAMWRRTLPGESPTASNGLSNVIKYNAKVLSKGTTIALNSVTLANELYYYIELDDNLAGSVGIDQEFLVQVGKWETDDNWSINWANAAAIAKNTIGGDNPVFPDPYVPAIPNQFDGTTSDNGWPAGGDYQNRQVAGIVYPWAKYDIGCECPPRLTWRIDYDGIENSHLKIVFLIVKTDVSGANPNNWPGAITNLEASEILYGQKLQEGAQMVDYQEVHFFGYVENQNRPGRETYQNQYVNEDPIYEDRSSFGVLKTNPKITGNIKLTVDSNGSLWLNTIDASEELSDARYKKYPISSSTTYQRDLYYFLNQGGFPKDSLYFLYQRDNQYLNTKREYSEQYDNFYNYGVEQLKSRFYSEDFSFFAPLWLRKKVPDFFVIFRLDHPLNTLSYNETTNFEKFSAFFENARIIKTFDMRESSPLGTYLRKIVDDPRFQERPLQVSFEKDSQTSWSGIDYASGSITSKGEILYDFWKTDNRILDFEETITGGFERNGIISTNLINLEFLFNDTEATPYTINRYFGFYVSENQLAEFEIESSVLGSIPGQNPGPRVGTDGEPYNLQPFIQTNPNGIQLPVHYYHNGSDGTVNLTNTPIYKGLTVGKFPLPPMVEDPLRVFYVKDRNGTLKRVNRIQEVTYGNINTPSGKRVTQLQLFDTSENISDYGGITQLSSQISAELLNSGDSQLVIFVEDLLDSGQPLEEGEVLEIAYKKINAEDRDYYYRLEAIASSGSVWDFKVFVPDYGGNTPTVPDVFYTEISIDTAGSGIASIDSFLTAQYVAGTITPGDTWDVKIERGNILSQTSTSGVDFNFFGSPNYMEYSWKLISNSTGLLPGESWEYPIMDPANRDYRNNFAGKGTPEQVAIAITSCINSFDNGIVEAYARGSAVYIKSLKKSEDGNSILFTRHLATNHSVVKNIGFYERCNVNPGNPIIEIDPQSMVILSKDRIKIKDSEIYQDRIFTVQITPFTSNSWSVFVGFDYDPINFGWITTANYFVGGGSTLLDLPEMTIDLNELNAYTAANIRFQTCKPRIEQYFIGGSKRKRGRAKISLENGKRYYQDRKINVQGSITNGSDQVLVASTNGAYIGAPIKGAGIPLNSFVTSIDSLSNILTISAPATATTSTLSITLGEISIINDAEIYQQWFQVQKGAYSRLKGWPVQGKYVYSLPDMEESNIPFYNQNSIIQVDDEKNEFYRTADRRIIAYQVYRPVFGVLSFYPIKNFDVDTYFSEYSYSPTLEMFRYFNREESSIENITETNNSIETPLLLNMGENYEFSLTVLEYDGENTDTVDAQLQIELYDSNDQTWKYADTITARFSLNPQSMLEKNSLLLNTFYPLYFYDNMEVPNDYDPATLGNDKGPYNDINFQSNSSQKDQRNTGPQYSAAGTRNYVRKVLYTDGSQEGKFTRARISKVEFWSDSITNPLTPPITPFSCQIRVQSVDYYNDNDIQKFAGFSSLTDFTTFNDIQEIQRLTEEKSIEKFTYQMLLSEYDRLRENSQKDLAVKSKVVPYILKWVQEGTDARDNYYRLNNSTAFGITNFSPDPEVDFTEPLLLTHEFPYLDSIPKNYPDESLEGSRSYFFQKLSDVAYEEKTWYELLTTDNTIDWFGKYFVVGSPTELNSSGVVIPKSREERYTFFNYLQGLDLSQTLFRGAKINVIDYDTTVTPRVPVNESKRFENYRFSAIARFVSHHNFLEEKPIEIELIDNKKFKSLLMIITFRVQDYRLAAGGGDYAFFYYAIDQLRNSMQTQRAGGYGTWSQFFRPRSNALGFTSPDEKYPMEMPYTASSLPYGLFLDSNEYFSSNSGNWSYFGDDIQQAYRIMRPRQLFLGAGRLELDDVKLGGKTWIVTNPSSSSDLLELIYRPLETTGATNEYPFIANVDSYYPIEKEIFPTIDLYRIQIDGFLGSTGPTAVPNFDTVDTASLPLPSSTMTVDGTISELNTNTITAGNYSTFSFFNVRTVPDLITIDTIRLQSTKKYQEYTNSLNRVRSIIPSAINFANKPTNTSRPPYDFYSRLINLHGQRGKTLQSYNLRGGTQFYLNRKNFISYANIFRIFNSESNYVVYKKIDETGSTIQSMPDFNLQFVAFDKIKKESKLYYRDDDDRPLEYQNTSFIGFDNVATSEQEYEFRHRGLYEPKTIDVIGFWAREDREFTQHYEKDFLLRNTHINGSSVLSGLIRNYFYNKVSDSEVLEISRTSAYKSLYPLIGEISIDRRDLNALDSSWDSNYYRKYTSTIDYIGVPGPDEMQEQKTFLASKAMIVPKSFTFETFEDPEVTFEIISPKKSIGVTALTQNRSNESDALQTKPILRIKMDLYARLQRGLLEGILDSESFDEFAWMDSQGIPQLKYTPAELQALKIEYLQKNIIPLYEVTSIIFYSNSGEGLPVFTIELTDSEKNSAGYRQDRNIKSTTTGEYSVVLEREMDTKSANAYTVSAVLKRI